MRWGDRLLQRWRIAKAARWIENDSRLLDIGCADGAIFAQLKRRIKAGVGIDPDIKQPIQIANGRLVGGYFPQDLPDDEPFDAITLLAVLEHIPTTAQAKLAADCFEHLVPGGRLIITVPSPSVDRILAVLKRLRLVDGMSLEEHYGFRPSDTTKIFEPAGLRLIARGRFQLGLNHWFVFEKSANPAPAAAR
jgi:SAM-dependent methyltransferase